MVMPIHLKWMLVWEHPTPPKRCGLGGHYVPRAWLAEGLDSAVVVKGAASSWGRLSFELRSHLNSAGCVDANITLHGFNATCGLPAGGVTLRLRTPKAQGITSVSVAGKPLPPRNWNATAETVSFLAAELTANGGGLADLQSVHVCYAK